MSNQPPLNPDALSAAGRLYGEIQACVDARNCAGCKHEAAEVIRAYLAAALPEVTERGQLTALPEKIVLEDRRGTLWQKINGNWYTPGSGHVYDNLNVMLPARVRCFPEVKP